MSSEQTAVESPRKSGVFIIKHHRRPLDTLTAINNDDINN